MPFSSVQSRSVTIQPSTQAQVYGLFSLAMGITVAGVFLGTVYAPFLIRSGMQMLFLIAELVLIFTSALWVHRAPLNLLLFLLFPFLSGLTVTPYVLTVLVGYANGAGILLNALLATALMAGASAVMVLVLRMELSGLGNALILGVVGLIALSLLQIFVPALRTGTTEIVVSGIGVFIFALFTAFDIQRIQRMGKMGASPFLLALSLYLDIFNLFLYVLRFMLALSGERR